MSREVDAFFLLAKREDIELMFAEESLAEIRKLSEYSSKRGLLEQHYFRLKCGKTVIRNSRVTYNDPIATYNSLDVLYDHSYDDGDFDAVNQFLRGKVSKSQFGSTEFDARYLAHAMLPENRIDVFVTLDKKTIWRHREEIKSKFNVEVKLPTEL